MKEVSVNANLEDKEIQCRFSIGQNSAKASLSKASAVLTKVDLGVQVESEKLQSKEKEPVLDKDEVMEAEPEVVNLALLRDRVDSLAHQVERLSLEKFENKFSRGNTFKAPETIKPE